MEMLSFVRAVGGRMARIAGRGVVMRVTIGGLRVPMSARASLRSHFNTESFYIKRKYKDTKAMGLNGTAIRHFMRAVSGRIARIAGHGVVMRITISGMRIPISARTSLQIQGLCNPPLLWE